MNKPPAAVWQVWQGDTCVCDIGMGLTEQEARNKVENEKRLGNHMEARPAYPLVYSWKLCKLWGPQGSPYHARRCRVIARGALNSRLVEFEDKTLVIVSGNALRRVD